MYVYINLETQEIFLTQELGTFSILEEEHKKLLETFKHPKDKIARNEKGEFYVLHYVLTHEEQQEQKREQARHELQEILDWFKDNDWKANKITLLEWDVGDLRAAEYLKERTTHRQRHKELCDFLGVENDRD